MGKTPPNHCGRVRQYDCPRTSATDTDWTAAIGQIAGGIASNFLPVVCLPYYQKPCLLKAGGDRTADRSAVFGLEPFSFFGRGRNDDGRGDWLRLAVPRPPKKFAARVARGHFEKRFRAFVGCQIQQLAKGVAQLESGVQCGHDVRRIGDF